MMKDKKNEAKNNSIKWRMRDKRRRVMPVYTIKNNTKWEAKDEKDEEYEGRGSENKR